MPNIGRAQGDLTLEEKHVFKAAAWIVGLSSSINGIIRFLSSGTSDRCVTASSSGEVSVAALRHVPFEEAQEEKRKAVVAGGGGYA